MFKAARKKLFQGIALIGLGAGAYHAKTLLDPTEPGPKVKLTYPSTTTIDAVFQELEAKKIIRSAAACKGWVAFKGRSRVVAAGTYTVAPGMTTDQICDELVKPQAQKVRVKEGRWIDRVADALKETSDASSAAYKQLTRDVDAFKNLKVPIVGDSLEGYLYPDTYNLSPGTDPKQLILAQLRNFEKKTRGLGLTKENIKRTLTVASLLELEANNFEDRAMIAGVIENRLKKGMPLQIDATVNYAMGEWRELRYSDYRTVKSPYNTYLNKGLPPGPICSPTVDSIRAALTPRKHSHLYYITFPDGNTYFADTYPEHLKNVAERDAIKKAR